MNYNLLGLIILIISGVPVTLGNIGAAVLPWDMGIWCACGGIAAASVCFLVHIVLAWRED